MKSYKKVKSNIIDKKLIKSLIFGVLSGVLAVIMLIIIASFVFQLTDKFPKEAVNIVNLAILSLGGLLGGYIAARFNKSSGLIVGLLTGFIIFIIILLAGLSRSVESLTIFTLYKLLALLIFPTLGGVIGVNKQKKIKI